MSECPKTEELLKVLDLPEDDQFAEVLVHISPAGEVTCSNDQYYYKGRMFWTLADLAFRLRDEAFLSIKGGAAWCQGCRIVIQAVNNSDEFPVWSKPIHWIIAALIAKQEKE